MRTTSTIWLAALVAACSSSSARPKFQPDARFQREVAFEFLDIVVPITRQGRYVRFDGVVPDLDAHGEKLKREFAITKFVFTNPATKARTSRVEFADGERLAVVYVKADEAFRLTGALAHEKYHVVAWQAPDGIAYVERALAAKGFPVRLGDHDEESAASIIEVAAIHLGGAPLEVLNGSELIEKAIEILKEARGD